MDIDIYKTTIRNEFSFAKSATSFAELLNRSIELPAGGCLVPLSYLHVDNDELIEKLSSWREAASDAYPTRFQVTCEGTRRWMKEAVLDKEDRLLFLIYEHSGRIVGHAGFANALNEQRILELDNIDRKSVV